MKIIRFHNDNGSDCIIGIAIELNDNTIIVQWIDNNECHIEYKDMASFNKNNSNIIITHTYEI